MNHLTLKEHLFLLEARRDDVVYTEKQVKSVVDRVTATLGGSDAAVMTKLAKRFVRLDNSLKAMKAKHDELNSVLKERVGDLFDAEDVVLTRVAETAQFTLTLAKEIKKDGGVEVDYKAIAEALSNLIAPELQGQVEMITAKYTKLVPGKAPIKRLTVSQKPVIEEGLLDNLKKLKDWATNLLRQVKSWAVKYDTKLLMLKRKAGLTD